MNKNTLNTVTVVDKTNAGFMIELVYGGQSTLVTIPEDGIIAGVNFIKNHNLNDSSRIDIELCDDGLFITLREIPQTFWCRDPHPTQKIRINKIISNVGEVKRQLQRFGL